MGAVLHDLASVMTLPSSVYLDASILLAAFRAAAKPAPSPAEALSRTFILNVARADPEAPWTSLLAVEEACWNPVKEEMVRTASHRGASISKLKAHDRRAYRAAYRRARPNADQLMQFLKGLPIHVRQPRCPMRSADSPGRAVCYLVRRLVHVYYLEMADCFHIAIAKLDGTDAIATLDKGFRDVDGIEVYTCI